MNKSSVGYALCIEFLLFLTVMVYLWLFKQQSLQSIWNEYGIPLVLALVIFTTFPFYRLLTTSKK